MSAEPVELIVPEENNLERVDRFLPLALEQDLSRSYIQKLIHGGSITVNGKTIKPNYKVKTDDLVVVVIPEPEPLELEPEDIPLDIVYQDKSIVVVNKQAGLVVHPGPGNWNRTMVNGLLYHIKDLPSTGGVARPASCIALTRTRPGSWWSPRTTPRTSSSPRSSAAAGCGRNTPPWSWASRSQPAVSSTSPSAGTGSTATR